MCKCSLLGLSRRGIVIVFENKQKKRKKHMLKVNFQIQHYIITYTTLFHWSLLFCRHHHLQQFIEVFGCRVCSFTFSLPPSPFPWLPATSFFGNFLAEKCTPTCQQLIKMHHHWKVNKNLFRTLTDCQKYIINIHCSFCGGFHK